MTELVWQGKYNNDLKTSPVRIALPFQTIETINESTQQRQKTLELFALGKETDWRNRLIWGDKKYVLPSLMPEFANKLKLIYIDPPFDTGADFSFKAKIPDNPQTEEDETTTFIKQPSIIEQKAYRDTWGKGLQSYLQWFYETIALLYELLSEDGSIYIHIDWHIGHYAKIILDEVFGYDSFKAEICWKKTTKTTSFKNYGSEHDVILYYVKSPDNYIFNQVFKPLKKSELLTKYRYLERPNGEIITLNKEQREGRNLPEGRRLRGIPLTNMNPNRPNLKYEFLGHTRVWAASKKRLMKLYKEGRIFQIGNSLPKKKGYLDENKGAKVNDVWDDINPVNSQAKERTGYDTQKPEKLLERIISVSTNPGDLVLDCFVGSGTTAAISEKLERRWIACDLGRFAIHTSRKRLLELDNLKPFVVQNLGKYELQHWIDAKFSRSKNRFIQEKAYKNFIIELYHAQPITGYNYLHGIKSGRMIHVGSVDAPVSLGDIKACIKEFWKSVGKSPDIKKNGIDILGWDFAFEINETAKQIASENKIDLKFRKIPREVLDKKAVEQGDIKFFEMACLDIKLNQSGKNVTLKLNNFVVPPDDLPKDVQKNITHWRQWIDYWAIDWNYRDDTFHNEWQSYRTKNDSQIELQVTHNYSELGQYMILVKVIDILGNDTTKMLKNDIK